VNDAAAGRKRLADAPPGALAERLAPDWARPFVRLARLDRPIGWWLLLLPCWWSTALAAIAADRPWPNPWHVLLFLIGAIAMRGAGSTWNDFLDRDLDKGVARTRHRPLAAGEVSVPAALAFAAAQALVGLAVLLQFNGFAIALGFASLIPVAVYPLMKRFTSWPQAVLGLAFAWGGLMGWAAEFGRLDPAAIALYAAAIVWTMGYDTIYAVQDLADDPVMGIRSTARLFGSRTRTMVAGFYAATIGLLALALRLADAGPVAFAGLVVFAAHLAWQVARIDLADPKRALMLFRSNRDAGLILFAFLSLDALVGNGAA
jgi:4-hydroxybenzoate polyprenyltransferase